MAMMMTTPPSCLRLPPDPPPSPCLNSPLESLSPVIPPEPPDPPDVALLSPPYIFSPAPLLLLLRN
ncbi:hypothetical protein F2Q69_00017104 [Brassica cretica]|uniref:Uncharacterized protein n=1 Tax=Brassica cretica TaxID=69181 RepID=A0A8S9R263_BRACR|nr:hypothetical protein F2Q69_00017104 [Brassica cretica]